MALSSPSRPLSPSRGNGSGDKGPLLQRSLPRRVARPRKSPFQLTPRAALCSCRVASQTASLRRLPQRRPAAQTQGAVTRRPVPRARERERDATRRNEGCRDALPGPENSLPLARSRKFMVARATVAPLERGAAARPRAPLRRIVARDASRPASSLARETFTVLSRRRRSFPGNFHCRESFPSNFQLS